MPGHPGAWRALSPGTAGKGLRGAALEGLGLAGPPGDCPARMGGDPQRPASEDPGSIPSFGHVWRALSPPTHTHPALRTLSQGTSDTRCPDGGCPRPSAAP